MALSATPHDLPVAEVPLLGRSAVNAYTTLITRRARQNSGAGSQQKPVATWTGRSTVRTPLCRSGPGSLSKSERTSGTNIARIGECFGVPSVRVRERAALDQEMARAFAATGRTLVEVMTDPEDLGPSPSDGAAPRQRQAASIERET